MGLQKLSVCEGDVILEVGVGTGGSVVECAGLVGSFREGVRGRYFRGDACCYLY
jgi:ubiquinone/menaquinone biosynthesis C-methylase UbiE